MTLHETALHELATSHALRGLAHVDLSSCTIDCKSVTAGASFAAELPNCARLERLDLAYNSLGDNFARALARHLPACRTLTRLDLSTTSLTDAGVCQLAADIPRCPGLVHLQLHGNRFTAETAEVMRAAWRTTHPHDVGLRLD